MGPTMLPAGRILTNDKVCRMFKIGEFARAARVSIKTLRYYDQCGLLKPVWKDRFTGYRYYHENQLEELDRIRALKEMGFSLDQIQTILQESLTLPQLKALLELKQTELREEISAGQSRLAQLEAQLNHLETQTGAAVQFPAENQPVPHTRKNKEFPKMKVHVKTKPAFTVVGTEYFGKNQNNEIKAMWQTTSPRLGEIKHAKVPPHIAYGVCGEMEEDGRFRYLAAVEVSKAEDVPEGMTSWEVPEQTYAVFGCTLPEIHQTYEYAHGTWIPENGYKRASGPDFEYYDEHFDPSDPASLLYIYIPINK